MKKFWELLQASVITQSLITLGVIGVYLYMMATGQTPGESLEAIVWVVVGFFFGSKYQMAMSQPMIDVAKDVMAQITKTIAENGNKITPPE